MTIAVIGKENSGKSALAEEIALDIAGDNNKIYLATMQVFDKAGEDRIKKHRKMRQGKGFITVEHLWDIDQALSGLEDISKSTVLLECVSNLVGNEMHRTDRCFGNDEELCGYICKEIKDLALQVENLICVCNEFCADNNSYDEETICFINNNNYVNQLLREEVDIIHEIS